MSRRAPRPPSGARRAAALLVTLCACGGGQTGRGNIFSLTRHDDGGAGVTKLETRLREAPIGAGFDVAIGVVDDDLLGAPLAGGSVWHYAHRVVGRPAVAGSVVLGAGDGELFCLRASTGHELWKRPIGTLMLRGAGDDGHITVVSLESTVGLGDTLLSVSRDGTVLRQLETPERLGSPAVVGGIAFIPWHEQYVSAYDVIGGEEVARVSFASPVSLAFTLDRTLFFAETDVTRFDAKIGGASRGAASGAALPARPVLSAGRWFPPSDQPTSTRATDVDMTRAYARAVDAPGGIAVGEAGFTTTVFRLAFGLAASDASLRWVHAHDADLIGGAAYRGGVALCDVNGVVTLLEQSGGAVSATARFGRPVSSCVVQADAMTRAPVGTVRPPLVAQMADALTLAEPELAPAQRVLLADLVARPDDEATSALLRVAADPHTPAALLADIERAIASRRTGVAALLAALVAPAPRDAGVARPLPLAAIADALARAGDPSAAGPLATQLADPRRSPLETRHIADALRTLATRAEYNQLASFFSLYYRTGQAPDVTGAVASVAAAMLRVGGAPARPIVAQAARDPHTSPALRDELARLLKRPATGE